MTDLTEIHTTFDHALFFSAHWRKSPLLVRGGAGKFLGRTWSMAEFDAARARALSSRPAISERHGEVAFIEKVSDFDENLAGLTDRFCRMFGAPVTWFDAIRTYSRSGIGSHFDHSDNFVLQQRGVKEWTLAAPRHIDKGDIMRRMMNQPGVGSHPLPQDDLVQLMLEPGDLLYIPLLWLHSGVSHGESLSISLVCPAVSLYSAVMPFLTRVLKSRCLGYQPVPALHSGLTKEARAAAAATLGDATRALLSRMTDDDLVEAVLAMQAYHP